MMWLAPTHRPLGNAGSPLENVSPWFIRDTLYGDSGSSRGDLKGDCTHVCAGINCSGMACPFKRRCNVYDLKLFLVKVASLSVEKGIHIVSLKVESLLVCHVIKSPEKCGF